MEAMAFDPVTACVRFGLGLRPGEAPPASAEAMLARLSGPDEAAARWPLPGGLPDWGEYAAASRLRRQGGTEAERQRGAERRQRLLDASREARAAQARALVARMMGSPDGLRERLALFWADHFTAVARNVFGGHLIAPFWEEAVRPHVAGRFGDMLRAAVTHPVMLGYLDQSRSVGPGSEVGLRRGRGLNENLARELLELHTLGVGGPYGQGDVRQLAELLSGLAVDGQGRAVYQPRRAEPGAETVLGTTFPAEASLATVEAALDALARHPATARHIGRKLAAHFVAAEPPEALVEALAAAFRDTGGDLLAVTAALLGRPEAWAPERLKVRPPLEFLVASLRALGTPEGAILALGERETRRVLLNPLRTMGQPWQEPSGPDGWPEEPEAWVTPQFNAGRIDWAMNRPEELGDLPDPRELVVAALGPAPPEAVAFAALAAERASEGVGCVLASAAFQRR